MKKNKSDLLWLRITRVQAMSRNMVASHRFKKPKTTLWTFQQLPKAITSKIAPDQIQAANRSVMSAQETGHTRYQAAILRVDFVHGHVRQVIHAMNSLPNTAAQNSAVAVTTKLLPHLICKLP